MSYYKQAGVYLMIKKPRQNFQPSNAEKAFVYQQTQDILSDLNNFGPVSVLLEKNENASTYTITFVLEAVSMKVLARSEGKNLTEVCMTAKNEMKKKLAVLAQSMENSPERDQFIEELKKSPYLH